MFQPEFKIDLATAIRILLKRRQGVGVNVSKVESIIIAHLKHYIYVFIGPVSEANKAAFFSRPNTYFTNWRGIRIKFHKGIHE